MEYSVKSIKSNRDTMEDEFSIKTTPHYSIFGVYDGHGGQSASKFCKKHMIPYLEKNLEKIIRKKKNIAEHIDKHIKKVFSDIDNEFGHTKYSLDTGTTAIVSIITDKLIILINCGDSRGILGDDEGNILLVTRDHKPNDCSERNRIKKADGNIISGRIDGILNLSRAIGDFDLKGNYNLLEYEQKVISLPEVCIIRKKDATNAKFLILASDGVWDTHSSEYIIDFVYDKYKWEKTLDEITEELFDECEKLRKCDDNKTIILVDLES